MIAAVQNLPHWENGCFFADEQGRIAHFSGGAAAALQANAEDLIEGGWNDGVIARVVHAEVIAGK